MKMLCSAACVIFVESFDLLRSPLFGRNFAVTIAGALHLSEAATMAAEKKGPKIEAMTIRMCWQCRNYANGYTLVAWISFGHDFIVHFKTLQSEPFEELLELE